jgi:hypothetical protein
MTEVATVIRAHSTACIPYLKRALFSLTAQTVDVFPIIVTQRLSETDLGRLEEECSAYSMGAIKKIECINVTEGEQHDIRSKLLNVGVSHVRTRFLHFLDFDDLMYADAYQRLTAVLLKSQAAIAFGAVTSCYFENVGGRPYVKQKKREYFGLSKYDLFVDNFCPLHSFVIDLSKVDKSSVSFDESMTALEDYNFLLDFLARHDADFSEINHVVGEYFKRDGDTIATADNEYPDPSLKLSRLQKAREAILIKKRSTKCEVRLSEFSWLTGKYHTAAIREENLANRRAFDSTGGGYGSGRVLQELQSRCLLEVCDGVSATTEGNGYVDFMQAGKSRAVIGGWVNDLYFGNSPAVVFAVHRATLSLVEAVRTDREDVRSHLASEYKQFGFELKIDLPIENMRINDWRIMMYSLDDGSLRAIPASDSFHTET